MIVVIRCPLIHHRMGPSARPSCPSNIARGLSYENSHHRPGQAQLARLVDKVSTRTRGKALRATGTRAAVLLGAGHCDAMMETVAILSDTRLVKELGKGISDLEHDDTFTAEGFRRLSVRALSGA